MRRVYRCRDGEPRPSRRYLYLTIGMKGETITDVSPRLLDESGGLRALFRMGINKLPRICGLGDAKAV